MKKFDIDLMKFEFSGDAKEFASRLTSEQLKIVEQKFKEEYNYESFDINYFFSHCQCDIREWLNLDFPVLFEIDTYLGNSVIISAADDDEAFEVTEACYYSDASYEEIGAAFDNPDIKIDAKWSDFDDEDDLLWEKKGGRYLRQVTVPMGWKYIIESGDCTGVDKEEKKAIKNFIKAEMSSPDEEYIWDDYNNMMCENPDYRYGEDCECDIYECDILHVYKKK